MVTADIKGNILRIKIVGELSYDEVSRVTDPLLTETKSITGMFTDIREITTYPVKEQRKLEQRRKDDNLQVPHALLGKDNALAPIVRLFIRFTTAENTRYFTSKEEALHWLKTRISQDNPPAS